MKSLNKGILTVCALVALCAAAYAVTWNGATSIFSSQTRSNETYTSTKADQNALLISTSGKVTINNGKVNKSGNSAQADVCRTYGINAGIMCKSEGGGETYINNTNITADGDNADGLFCLNASVYLNDSVVSSPRGRGVAVGKYGYAQLSGTRVYCDGALPWSGAVSAEKMGSINIYNGKAWGSVCPAIYSAGYVYAEGAELLSIESPAVAVAAGGSAELHNCDIIIDPESENPTYAVKLLTDGASGTASFILNKGSIDSMDKFCVKTPQAFIYLEGVEFKGYPGTFLDVSPGDDENAATSACETNLDMYDVTVEGDVAVSHDCSLIMSMYDRSFFAGSINNCGAGGPVEVNLYGDSVWKLTADSYIHSIHLQSPGCVDLNGHTLYVNGAPWSPYGTDVTGVSLNMTSTTLFVGDSVTLEATVTPSNASNKAVVWTSYDKAVATVDANGKVKGVAPGTTTIRVKTKDKGFTAKCKVTVKEPVVAVTGVSLNKTKATLEKGKNVTLKATVTPSDAANKAVTWTSYDKAVATVDANGKVKGVAPGTTTIRAKTKDGGFTAKCKVTVKEPVVAVTGVSLNKTKATLEKGKTVTLKATVTPSGAANKAVTWTSYDTAIATVDANGRVKGIAPGTTTIRVKTKDGGFTAKCKVTVKEPVVAVTGVTLNKTKATVDVGASVTLKATVTPSDAANKAVTWTSYDTAIATVDANGKVKGVAPGTTTIRVKTKDGGFTAKCKVTVKEPAVAVEGVSLDKTKATLEAGASVTLKATVTPSGATNQAVTWTSYDKTVATVDANGRVKGIAPGTTTIRVKTKDGGFTDKCKVTVQ